MSVMVSMRRKLLKNISHNIFLIELESNEGKVNIDYSPGDFFLVKGKTEPVALTPIKIENTVRFLFKVVGKRTEALLGSEEFELYHIRTPLKDDDYIFIGYGMGSVGCVLPSIEFGGEVFVKDIQFNSKIFGIKLKELENLQDIVAKSDCKIVLFPTVNLLDRIIKEPFERKDILIGLPSDRYRPDGILEREDVKNFLEILAKKQKVSREELEKNLFVPLCYNLKTLEEYIKWPC